MIPSEFQTPLKGLTLLPVPVPKEPSCAARPSGRAGIQLGRSAGFLPRALGGATQSRQAAGHHSAPVFSQQIFQVTSSFPCKAKPDIILFLLAWGLIKDMLLVFKVYDTENFNRS